MFSWLLRANWANYLAAGFGSRSLSSLSHLCGTRWRHEAEYSGLKINGSGRQQLRNRVEIKQESFGPPALLHFTLAEPHDCYTPPAKHDMLMIASLLPSS